MAAPLEYKASIVYFMTFLETLSTLEPGWQSKDLLVLFYPESDYSLSVKEFLDAYYTDDANEMISGRCGYLRQGFPFVIKDYDFKRVSLLVDGINSQLSDLDLYDQVKDAVKMTDFNYDTGIPSYFRKNPFISGLSKKADFLVDAYMHGL